MLQVALHDQHRQLVCTILYNPCNQWQTVQDLLQDIPNINGKLIIPLYLPASADSIKSFLNYHESNIHNILQCYRVCEYVQIVNYLNDTVSLNIWSQQLADYLQSPPVVKHLQYDSIKRELRKYFADYPIELSTLIASKMRYNFNDLLSRYASHPLHDVVDQIDVNSHLSGYRLLEMFQSGLAITSHHTFSDNPHITLEMLELSDIQNVYFYLTQYPCSLKRKLLAEYLNGYMLAVFAKFNKPQLCKLITLVDADWALANKMIFQDHGISTQTFYQSLIKNKTLTVEQIEDNLTELLVLRPALWKRINENAMLTPEYLEAIMINPLYGWTACSSLMHNPHLDKIWTMQFLLDNHKLTGNFWQNDWSLPGWSWPPLKSFLSHYRILIHNSSLIQILAQPWMNMDDIIDFLQDMQVGWPLYHIYGYLIKNPNLTESFLLTELKDMLTVIQLGLEESKKETTFYTDLLRHQSCTYAVLDLLLQLDFQLDTIDNLNIVLANPNFGLDFYQTNVYHYFADSMQQIERIKQMYLPPIRDVMHYLSVF